MRILIVGLAAFGALLTVGPRATTPPTPAPVGDAPPSPVVSVPESLPALDPGCVAGTWTTAPEALDVITNAADPAARVIAGRSVLTIGGDSFLWEASFTVEFAASAVANGTVPMDGVVTQADVWWSQRGQLVTTGSSLEFSVGEVSSGVTTTRAYIDGGWMAFPGEGEFPALPLSVVAAVCSAERLELYLEAITPDGPVVLVLDRDLDR